VIVTTCEVERTCDGDGDGCASVRVRARVNELGRASDEARHRTQCEGDSVRGDG
jgi:hypothetical protein